MRNVYTRSFRGPKLKGTLNIEYLIPDNRHCSAYLNIRDKFDYICMRLIIISRFKQSRGRRASPVTNPCVIYPMYTQQEDESRSFRNVRSISPRASTNLHSQLVLNMYAKVSYLLGAYYCFSTPQNCPAFQSG